jgi:DNA invertase Pin-like site-specific DNA recombinase
MNVPSSLMSLSRRPRRGPASDPLRAVAYVRASTSKQAASPAAQLAAIRTWAAKEGVAVVAVFEDKATSGDADLEDRPGVLAAVESLRQHRAGLLVVAKRDRLARDRVVAGLLERLVQKAGAKVTSADGMSEGDGPEATLLKGILDLFSEFEVGVIRARTRGALAHRKAAGLRVGGVPFGFRVARDGKHLIPCEREREVLALMRRLHRTRSLRGVIEELYRRKIGNRTGKVSWTVGQVHRLLVRDSSAGP